MAVQKVGHMALDVVNNDQESKEIVPVPAKKVLDEESYIEDVEKIVVRDFFPDLPKLHAQSEFLEALEKNDVVKLREIHIKYGPKRDPTSTPRDIYSTPSTFETPLDHTKQTPRPPDGSKPDDNSVKDKEEKPEEPTHNPEEPQKKQLSDLKLDRYLSKVTSEDNSSFEDIQQQSELKRRLKHEWLYDKEGETREDQQARLALPPVEQQAITENSGKIDTWTYVNKNALMYPPEGVAESTKDVIKKASKPKEIHHENTRFASNPFNLQKSSTSIQQAAISQSLAQHGKIGVDGKEVLAAQSPSVKGYGFMATPSPAPGVEDSPFMTWGEIEGTPFRLDGGDTPLIHKTPGPIFKIPETPQRDRLAHELADKVGASHRAKKEKALSNARASLASPITRFGSGSRSSRLASMSPAAQRLASAKLGIRANTDKALKASYTPSPRRATPGRKTPSSVTPGSKRKDLVTTPKSGLSTPKGTPSRDAADGVSLTDNLLNLPKRHRAQDYF